LASPPTNIDEVKGPWLEDVLGISSLEEFSITSPCVSIGYGSEIGFLKIVCAEPSVPANLIIKVPPKDQQRRKAVLSFGAFQKEIMFYRSIAPKLPIRTPRVYKTEFDRNTGAGILLLEDCSRMKSFRFDQQPPLAHELEDIVRALARLHAFWWNDTKSLARKLPNATSASNKDRTHTMEIGWRNWLKSSLPIHLPDSVVKLALRLSNASSQLQNQTLGKNKGTLTHMDFHLQNIFYDFENKNDPVVVIDWDSFEIGCGTHDIAYMTSLLPICYRRTHEENILNEYHKELVSLGIKDYDTNEMYSDYQFGSLIATSLQPVLMKLSRDNREDQSLLRELTMRQSQLVFDHHSEDLIN